MMHRRKHSEGSRASDHSTDPLLNRDGSRLEETFKWKPQIFDDLRTKINGLNFDFDRNHQKLTGQIKKLNGITNELESMHKKTKVGSLVGSSIGAAGGIAALVGLALAPVTLGASLALTVGGAVAGAAGGLTGVASDSINTVQQTNLRETIEKITSDFLNTINAMTENLNTINNSTEDIRQMVQQKMNYIPARMTEKADGAGKVRGVSASTGPPKAETHQKSQEAELFDTAVGLSKEAFKGFQVCSGTVKKICSSKEIVKNANLSSKAVKTARLSSNAAKTARVSAQAAKATRALALSGVISALSVVLDVVSIVQDSIEIAEINQSADPRKAKKITSETVKFINQMRETVAQFQKTLDEIKDERDIAIKEFEKELKNGISFLARQNDRDIANKEFEKELKNGTSFLARHNRRRNRNVLFVKIIVSISIVIALLVLCFFRETLHKYTT